MNTNIKYSIKDGYNEMDFDAVTNMLKDAFWSIGISKDEVVQGVQNSALLLGAFTADNEQVGYSRVISDRIRFCCAAYKVRFNFKKNHINIELK